MDEKWTRAFIEKNPFSHVLFVTFVLLKYNCDHDDDVFSSFLSFASTTTTKYNHDGI